MTAEEISNQLRRYIAEHKDNPDLGLLRAGLLLAGLAELEVWKRTGVTIPLKDGSPFPLTKEHLDVLENKWFGVLWEQFKKDYGSELTV